MIEYCPHQYRRDRGHGGVLHRDRGGAERQVSSTYSRLSRPELGEKDLAARMMAEETIQELLYPHRPRRATRSRWTPTRQWPSRIRGANRTSGQRGLPTHRPARPGSCRSGSKGHGQPGRSAHPPPAASPRAGRPPRRNRPSSPGGRAGARSPRSSTRPIARFAATQEELHTLLSEPEWAAARRTTINAHYTSAEVVQAVWSAVSPTSASPAGRVLEPGCGSGNFIGFAPAGCARSPGSSSTR